MLAICIAQELANQKPECSCLVEPMPGESRFELVDRDCPLHGPDIECLCCGAVQDQTLCDRCLAPVRPWELGTQVPCWLATAGGFSLWCLAMYAWFCLCRWLGGMG